VGDPLSVLTARTPGESVDVLVTWVGGITLLRYRLAIARRHAHSPLERRAAFLVSALAALLLMRGVSWLHPDRPWLGSIILLPAALLPLAMTLFTEGLLRRHVPRPMKWLAVAATIVATGAALAALFTGRDDLAPSAVLLVALLTTISALSYLLARRDRASLSRAENGLVRACLLVALIGIPLVATDFRFVLGNPPARLGTIAALLLCYTLLRRSEERGQLARWGRDVARLLWRAAAVCALLLVALRTAPAELLFPLGVLATTLVIALAIHDRISDLRLHGADPVLLRWLARAPATSLVQFQRELRHLPLTSDALVVEEADLEPYNHDALRIVLAGREQVQTLAQLRASRPVGRADEGRALAVRGADELTDLLERSSMTHVALVTSHPLRLLLANIPELPGHEDASIALAAVVRHGQLALSHESGSFPT
jgi:hypothetical protein